MKRAVLETASDRYLIADYLAAGGMGAIYTGQRVGSDGLAEDVVLKQLLPELTKEARFIERFLKEARLSAALVHRNIVRTVNLVHAGDDYFMVMEYVRGADLRTLLRRARRRRRRLSPKVMVHVGLELLAALAYAHGEEGTDRRLGSDGRPLELIHRDLTPSNVLISEAGEVKLTDFGIARAESERPAAAIEGKVGYMSPEQARGESVDRRTDLFSLAVVLYEVLVGERLFVGGTLAAASMVYAHPITPPSQVRPELPMELDQFLLRALAIDPNHRFQSAIEMRADLADLAERHGLRATQAEVAVLVGQACGDRPADWMKPERPDDSQAITHGTAVDYDPFAEPVSYSGRMPVSPVELSQRELTSMMIRLEGGEAEPITEEAGSFAEPTPVPPARARSAAPRIDETPLPPPIRVGAETDSIREWAPQSAAEARQEEPAQSVGNPFGQSAQLAAAQRQLGGRRKLWGVVVVVILLAVGAAVGIALSGPEMETGPLPLRRIHSP